jgi:hypothetical protein
MRTKINFTAWEGDFTMPVYHKNAQQKTGKGVLSVEMRKT